MESSLDRENSQGTTRTRVADDDVHKHGEEVSSAEDGATAPSSVRGAQERMVSGSKRLEDYHLPLCHFMPLFHSECRPTAVQSYRGLCKL